MQLKRIGNETKRVRKSEPEKRERLRSEERNISNGEKTKTKTKTKCKQNKQKQKGKCKQKNSRKFAHMRRVCCLHRQDKQDRVHPELDATGPPGGPLVERATIYLRTDGLTDTPS